MKGSRIKKILAIAAAVVIIVAILGFAQCLVVPKYVNDVPEGALIAEYYDDDISHDVLFVGDCEVYENFSPLTMYENYGINSYIRGSAQQLIWQSYYLLEDALRYETPEVVVFNVLSMKYNEPQNEAYNRMTLEGMKWSASKVAAINSSMTEDESFITYLFPLLRYHDRITELTPDDFKYMLGGLPSVSCRGAYLRDGVVPAENVTPGKPLADYNFGDTAWEYLEKMRTLCEENGIRLVLIKAPSLYPYWYDEWEQQIEEYAEKNSLTYVNFLELTDEAQIDFATDTYDGGLHLNRTGAEKLSVFFGQMLSSWGVPDRRGEAESDSSWEKFKTRMQEQETLDTSAGAENSGNTTGVESSELNISEGDKNLDNSSKQGLSSAATKCDVVIGNQATSYDDIYHFKNKNLKLAAGVKMSEYLDELGEPISYFEAKSCAFDGLDKMYSYAGFEVDTAPDSAGEDVISMIFLTDDSVMTVEGTYIGDSRANIERIYGEPTSSEENVDVYVRGNSCLTFIFKNDYAISITYTVPEE